MCVYVRTFILSVLFLYLNLNTAFTGTEIESFTRASFSQLLEVNNGSKFVSTVTRMGYYHMYTLKF